MAEPEKRFNVVGPDEGLGERWRGTVPESGLADALKMGYELESQEDTLFREEAKAYDRPIQAGLEAGLSSATFGLLSGVVAGGEERAKKLARHNPTATTIGNVAGVAAPALASGGTGLLGTAARLTPAGMAARVGVGAGKLAEAGVLGLEGGGLLARAAARAVPLAAEGVVEGGLFGAGSALQKAALSDEPLNAEAFFSEVGMGALLGGGIGGTLGVGGTLLKEAAIKGRGALKAFSSHGKVGDDIALAVTKQDLKAAGREAVEAARQRGTLAKIEAPNLKAARETEVASLAKSVPEELAALQTEMRASVAGFRTEVELLEEASRQISSRAKLMGDMGVSEPGILKARRALAKAELETVDAIKAIKNSSDDAVLTELRSRPDLIKSLQRHEDATVQLLRNVNPESTTTRIGDVFDGFSSPSESVQKVLAKGADLELRLSRLAEPLTSPKLKEIEAMQKVMDDAMASSKENARLIAARGIVKKAESAGMQAQPDDLVAAARELGMPIPAPPPAGSPQEIVLKAHAYQRAAVAKVKEMAKSDLSKEVIGAATGMAIDEVTGNKLGYLGSVLGGGWLGGRLLRGVAQRGLSGIKGRLLQSTQNAADKISAGIDGFLTAASKAKTVIAPAAASLSRVLMNEAPKASKNVRENFKQVTQQLADAVANQDATRLRVHERLEGARAVDLGFGDQTESLAMKSLVFLHSKMPKNPGMGTAFDRYSRWEPTDTELAKFSRYVAAATSPTRLIEELQAGQVSPETVETIRELYPAMYSAIQLNLINRVTELRQELPYEKRLQLSILFGVPVDSTASPEFVAKMQESFLKEEEAKSGPAPAKLASIKKPEPTKAQSLASR